MKKYFLSVVLIIGLKTCISQPKNSNFNNKSEAISFINSGQLFCASNYVLFIINNKIYALTCYKDSQNVYQIGKTYFYSGDITQFGNFNGDSLFFRISCSYPQYPVDFVMKKFIDTDGDENIILYGLPNDRGTDMSDFEVAVYMGSGMKLDQENRYDVFSPRFVNNSLRMDITPGYTTFESAYRESIRHCLYWMGRDNSKKLYDRYVNMIQQQRIAEEKRIAEENAKKAEEERAKEAEEHRIAAEKKREADAKLLADVEQQLHDSQWENQTTKDKKNHIRIKIKGSSMVIKDFCTCIYKGFYSVNVNGRCNSSSYSGNTWSEKTAYQNSKCIELELYKSNITPKGKKKYSEIFNSPLTVNVSDGRITSLNWNGTLYSYTAPNGDVVKKVLLYGIGVPVVILILMLY